MLAVDFDQHAAQSLQHLQRDRLVIDKGARAAVRKLHATQDQLILSRNLVRRKERMDGVAGLRLEHGRHLSLLGAGADQARIAARAQREREGVEQYRLAGARFAGQHGKAAAELDVEPVDQHDIADRESDQHAVHRARSFAEAVRVRGSEMDPGPRVTISQAHV